jgi:hypothetical protein
MQLEKGNIVFTATIIRSRICSHSVCFPVHQSEDTLVYKKLILPVPLQDRNVLFYFGDTTEMTTNVRKQRAQENIWTKEGLRDLYVAWYSHC